MRKQKEKMYFFILLSLLNAVLQTPVLKEFKIIPSVLKNRLLHVYVSSHLVSIFICFKDKTFLHLEVK